MYARTTKTLLLAAVGTALLASPGFARHARHARHVAHAYPYATQAYGYAPYPPQAYGGYYGTTGWEGALIARRTAEAYHEPGVTLELAPDSKQTATGGPAGGVPGFSGF